MRRREAARPARRTHARGRHLNLRHRAVQSALRSFTRRCAAGLLSIAAVGAPAQQLSLDLDAPSGDAWRATKLRIALVGGGAARLEASDLVIGARRFARATLDCARFSMEGGAVRCSGGKLAGLEPEGSIAVEIDWRPQAKSLRIAASPGPGEAWVVEQSAGETKLTLAGAALERVVPWLAGPVRPLAGRASGTLLFTPQSFRVDLTVVDAGFSNATGLIAGEGLAGTLRLAAARAGDAWRWRGALGWDKGAVLVDPIYVAEGGHMLDAEGVWAGSAVTVETARLDWKDLGRLALAGRYDFALGTLSAWSVAGDDLALDGLKALLPPAWLESQGLQDLRMTGRGDIAFRADGEEIRDARLRLRSAAFELPGRRIAIDGIALDFAHANEAARAFRFGFERARVRDLALGPAEATGEVRDARLSVAHFVVPVEEGFLALNEIEIWREARRWQGNWRGAFTPLSMQRLTRALGWHPMTGSISAVLPQMRYRDGPAGSTFSVDGALLFKVFSGDASVEGIRIDNPFGRTPRLAANLRLTGLDLETMTGAVKFGSISGRVDVSVEGLEMENWQPLAFDARIATSAGDFRKRISQRAVQNISSIGGAGAGAAIQASFLRFFDTFGYDRLGLSCRLANGVCEMGGIETSKSGPFTLVKGGGLPALNVVGYNRRVGWQEMLERIRSVIDGNSRMIVQ